MTYSELKRFTLLFFLLAGLYISVFAKNLNYFFIEVCCFATWILLGSVNNRRKTHDDGK